MILISFFAVVSVLIDDGTSICDVSIVFNLL